MKNNSGAISYVTNDQVDKERWDDCIDKAGNGLIYAYSFYLDAMSQHWDALILDDYAAVMPLTWNKKFGIHYLYQPFFAASLGVFGNEISAEIVTQFLNNIPAKFKYWDFYLNRKNVFQLEGYNLYQRRNYILDLHETFDALRSNYSKSHIRNIKRSKDQGHTAIKEVPIEDVINLAKEQSKTFSPVTDKDYANFTSLFHLLHKKQQAITYGVYSVQKQLLASCVYFFSHGRAYYIMVGNHPNGRSSGASHLLINEFIQEHAGEKLLLDFEGSDIKNLAWFYGSFGATEEIYAGIKVNRLPAIARLFKQ